MKYRFPNQWTALASCAALTLLWAGTAQAVPVPATYEIDSYNNGSYSASWIHTATGCRTDRKYRLPLYMCGKKLPSIKGSISGQYYQDYNVLKVTGGSLHIGGDAYHVGGGYLGSFTGNRIWSLELQNFGRFFFENLGNKPGLPNYFGPDKFVLWGQNLSAYFCGRHSYRKCGPRWGIDLYGKRTKVSEPGTLALLGVGLLALAATRRRKTAVSRPQ